MKRTCKLLVVAMAVSALSIAGLKAGWSSQREQPSPASNDPAAFSLTVENGKPSGSFKTGTQVVVSADAPPIGAQFAGWTGDVAILANPFLPKTTATIPYMAVTITATYTVPAVDLLAILDALWGG
jgi:hypothetical protein